jgi:hypothetical protein
MLSLTLALWLYVNSKVVGLAPGSNPTIVSYSASFVKIYSAASSLVHFQYKNILFHFDKRSSLVVVNLEVVCRIGSWLYPCMYAASSLRGNGLVCRRVVFQPLIGLLSLALC